MTFKELLDCVTFKDVAKGLAEESRKMGIKTIGVVTLPFEFEGSRKFNQAAAGLAELAKNTDAMFV